MTANIDVKLTVRAVKVLLVDSISLRSKFLSRHDMSITIWRNGCNSIYKNIVTFEHKSQITHNKQLEGKSNIPRKRGKKNQRFFFFFTNASPKSLSLSLSLSIWIKSQTLNSKKNSICTKTMAAIRRYLISSSFLLYTFSC